MKNRIVSTLLTLALLCAVLPQATLFAHAETVSGTCGASGDGSNLTWSFNSETGVLTVSGSGEMADFGYWASPWYDYVNDITAVVLSDGVTGIGQAAFFGCWAAKSAVIPFGVTKIGRSAFYNCRSLESLTLPDSVTDIGEEAFRLRSSLQSLTIPASVTDIGKGAFGECSGVTSVTFGSDATTIGDNAFWSCSSLTSITLPSELTSIPANAFADCRALTGITIPDGVTSIGEGAFLGCCSLTDVTIPDGVTSIGGQAFRFCPMTELALPNTLTSIDFYAFADCTGLTSVTIPDGVTYLGRWAFSGCTGLTSVTIPGSVTMIDNRAFYACTGLTSVTIPDGVTTVGMYAFTNCTGLFSVTIPKSVTTISWYAFGFVVDDETEQETAIEGFTIYGYADSEAKTYAERNGFAFVCAGEHAPGEAVKEHETNPTCTAKGSYDSVICCTVCGLELSREAVEVDALGHDFGAWTQTNASTCTEKGEEKRTCSRCDAFETREIDALGHDLIHHDAKAATCTEIGWEAYDACTRCEYSTYTEIPALGHDYQSVVTAPTAEAGGYTTWTCSRCGDSFTDSFTDPLGDNYTVTFSVLGDTGVIAPMVCNTLTGIALPEAEGPQGFRFLGWTVQDCYNVTEMPENIFTGVYTAIGDVTLRALFAWNDYGQNPPKLVKMGLSDTFSDGDQIVIVESGGVHGLYQKSHNYAYVRNFAFTEDAEALLADELTHFTVTKVDGGWYLGDEVNGWLYTPDNTANLTIRNNTAFMTAFTLTTLDGHLALQHTVSYNDNVFYVNCGTNLSGQLANKWRMVNANNMSGVSTLDIYKLYAGGPAVVRYTTMLHTHTPGEPVKENELAPTCTEVGGYDLVVCCTGCGLELSREHTELPALGHDFGAWTQTAAPTCTEKGMERHDCTRCDAFETREIDALGHDLIHHDPKPATCTEIGWEAYDTCSRCAYTTYEEIAALGHHYVDGVCTVCGEEDPDYEPAPHNPFVDVKEGAYYYDAVLWAVNADPQVTAGTSATTFSPDKTCTRAQVVTFLWRANGQPEPTALQSVGDGALDVPFDDISSDAYYYKAVLWAVENGITSGTSATTFSPNRGCTRGQVVTFLWRTEGKPPVGDGALDVPFTDVSKDAYYYKAVLWAVENKITAGTSATAFSPDRTCTRGQVVTFLYRDLAE